LTATYRLQLHRRFTFDDAAAIVPYLGELGVSHLYLSPVLQATPGSMHGYDVVDHGTVSSELGGREGLERLADRAHDHGLGILVDVVPNHMAIPSPEYLNHQLWDVLERGRSSAYAHWFDVDWDLCAGRLGLPLLGAELGTVLAAGELRLDVHDGQPVVRYGEHVFPVADGTEDGDVAQVLARQHYLLGSWRDNAGLLGYRRFFDVDTLIAVRVELDDVFDATHAVLLDLYAEGVVDGFRIDHPDGLADPEAYLARLADATHGAWVAVEKILIADERLPDAWQASGTTGYDAITAVQTALSPPSGRRLDDLWSGIAGQASVADVELAAKRQVVSTLLAPEVARLARVVREISAVPRSDSWPAAIAELLVHVDVYRVYLRPGTTPTPAQVDHLDRIVERARRSRPDLSVELSWLRDRLCDVASDDLRVQELLVRFQQVCGPVMAKGVEDTTFYRHNRLLALNEVGGDPDSLLAPGPERLHEWAAHQQRRHPLGLTTLSTHDTKRSEDVRARLLALAADPDSWEELWSEVWARATARGVDGPTAYLVFQTVLGAWPIDEGRLTEYLTKAMREAAQHTSWTDPQHGYEDRVHGLARDCLSDAMFTVGVERLLGIHAEAISTVTLGQKLIQLTLPGVPDCYQGCESVALTLVDPDNRRPVDHPSLHARLVRLSRAGGLSAGSDESLVDKKLWVTARTLRLRRDRPELFGPGSAYRPLDTSADVVGFVREGGAAAAATVVRRVRAGAEGEVESEVLLPAGRWTDVLTGRPHSGGRRATAGLLIDLPVALLVSQDAARVAY
jgi:(1->4)-alpha-D-glucan 1-alpha-D-glucosylmutase